MHVLFSMRQEWIRKTLLLEGPLSQQGTEKTNYGVGENVYAVPHVLFVQFSVYNIGYELTLAPTMPCIHLVSVDSYPGHTPSFLSRLCTKP